MSQSLFSKITSIENLELAFRKSQEGKSKYDKYSLKFYSNLTYNLLELQREIILGEYEFGEYLRFKVYEPKERVINAPQFKDKLVQLAINNIIKDIYQPTFIFDSYACIDNKGTHKCVDRVSYFMRKSYWEYGETTTIIKMDIKKFFYTIDRDILKDILPKKITCEKTLKLIFEIIDSANSIDLVGLPLGNTLSQICANIYMNKVDQYCKRVLSLKYYIRYADDVIIEVDSKEKANEVLKKIVNYINKELNLNINEDKTKIFPIEQGANTVGFKIHRTHRLLRNESKKKLKRRIKSMPKLIKENRMTIEKAEQMLNSWKGHATSGNSYNFINKIIDKYKFIYMNDRGILKININELEE